MKKLASVLSFCLAFIMVLSLCACGGDKLVGKWESEIEMKEIIFDGMDSATRAEVEEMFDFDDLTLVVQAEYKQDGTFKMYADADTLYDDLYDIIEEGLRESFEEVIEQENSDMSVSELLNYMGTSLDELTKELVDEFDIDDLTEESTTEGRWKLIGDKLLTSDDVDEEPDEYTDIKIEGDTLILYEEEDTFTFKRVG